MSWQAPGEAGLLLSLADFVLNPRADILWFAIRRRLLNDRDLHEFTPIGLIDWELHILASAAVRCAKLTNADSRAPR